MRVVGIDAESDSVFSLRLAASDTAPLPAAPPGQFLTVRLRPDADSPPLIRSYSLSGRSGAAEYRISVKREPGGTASNYPRGRVRPGDTLEVAAPRGTLTLAAGDEPVLLLSAGIGATPVLAMLHAHVATGVCHTCETGLLSGAVAYSPPPVEAPAEGNALTRCSQP